jgi:hypothetical protein
MTHHDPLGGPEEADALARGEVEGRSGGLCCDEHGPECTNGNHPVVTLDLWRASKGLCGICGEVGAIRWGESIQIARGHFTLRCRRCVLRAQIEHARERAAALPSLEAELREMEDRP